MSSGMIDHSHFEELCALAAVGQTSAAEFAELSAHLRDCSACQSAYNEFTRLTHAQLPLTAAERRKKSSVIGHFFAKDYKSRFVSLARERGLHIEDQAPTAIWARTRAFSVPLLSYQSASAVAIMALLLSAGVFFYRWKATEVQAASAAARVSVLSEQNKSIEKQLLAASRDKEIVQSDLSQRISDRQQLSAQVRDLQEQTAHDRLALQQNLLALQNSRAEVRTANDRTSQAEQALRDAQQKLLTVNQQLGELRASQSQGDAALLAQHIQFAELTRRVNDQEEVIEKQQKLLSVDTDVRNLMAARNLHITDVFDVDGKGKKKAAFGRVFYTEGKSLLFYAFDLAAPKIVNAKHSFQAWGQLADGSSSAVNLGIFYVDDPAQKRWMLRFDNPEVLKQISAVFVTAEPHGGRERPTGQKLMYAYLGHEPNHP